MSTLFWNCKVDGFEPFGPVCSVLGYFLGQSCLFFLVLLFNPVVQVSQDIFGNNRKPCQHLPLPSGIILSRNLALQLHAPVNSDFLFISLSDPSECIAIKILILSANMCRLQKFFPDVFILEVTDCSNIKFSSFFVPKHTCLSYV